MPYDDPAGSCCSHRRAAARASSPRPWATRPAGRGQKNAIWEIYLGLFELDPGQARPDDDSWTGAEIRACCRLAALLDVPLVAAAQNVVPVA